MGFAGDARFHVDPQFQTGNSRRLARDIRARESRERGRFMLFVFIGNRPFAGARRKGCEDILPWWLRLHHRMRAIFATWTA